MNVTLLIFSVWFEEEPPQKRGFPSPCDTVWVGPRCPAQAETPGVTAAPSRAWELARGEASLLMGAALRAGLSGL